MPVVKFFSDSRSMSIEVEGKPAPLPERRALYEKLRRRLAQALGLYEEAKEAR